jgi:hypothetical protein
MKYRVWSATTRSQGHAGVFSHRWNAEVAAGQGGSVAPIAMDVGEYAAFMRAESKQRARRGGRIFGELTGQLALPFEDELDSLLDDSLAEHAQGGGGADRS